MFSGADPRGCTTLVEVLRRRSDRQPERLAYRFLVNGDDVAVEATWADVDRRARSIAASLQARGGARGARVLLLCPPGLDYVAAFYGCLYAEAIPVPAYPPQPREMRPAMARLAAVAEDAAATLVVTTPDVAERAAPLWAADPRFAAVPWLHVGELDQAPASDWDEARGRPDDVALLQYTSGATSHPKGVALTHANLLHNLESIRRYFEFGPDTPGVSWLPLYHDMGLIGCMLEPLYAGFPMTLLSPLRFVQRPILWLRAITRYRASMAGAPNFAYELCVSRTTPEQREGLDLSSWRSAFNGSEAVRADTLQRFAATFGPHGFDARAFRPCYGLAEGSLLVTGSRTPGPRAFDAARLTQGVAEPAGPDTPDDDVRALVSCGQSWGNEVIVVDAETGTRCPPGRVGHVWVRGGSVSPGYWNRGRDTESFGAHLATGEGPWLDTGDLGFLQDGELFVTGRLKELVVIRGRKHHPQDIEQTVGGSHPALRAGDAAAFAIEEHGEEALVVVQAVDRAWLRRLAAAEVSQDVNEALGRTHGLTARTLLFVRPGTIPRTSSGKIMRTACRQLFLDGALAPLAAAEP